MISVNVLIEFPPRSRPAISSSFGKLLSAVLAIRLPSGSCRKIIHKRIIQTVPVSLKGGLLKAKI